MNKLLLLLTVNMAWLPMTYAQQPLSSQPQKASKNMEISNEDLEFEKNKTTLQKMISFPNDKIKAINLLAIELHSIYDLKFDKKVFMHYKQENTNGWRASFNGAEADGWFRIENEKINSVFNAIKNIPALPRNNEHYIWLGEMIEIEYFNQKPVYIIIEGQNSSKQKYLIAEIEGISDKPIRITVPLKDIQNLFYSIDNTHILFSYFGKKGY
ncbi:hypothetical protein [Kingella sp. (in: b-proteobacteria)]|uniref:hypothetical protein n=1 Tax=Kingella sp. (in: b-proteobacteria) TaxID=2020713 RepID=UPI0026DC7A38|nr:hypothetical protein [Kingella sp. (in: b-proteobacteria)]MDO4656344.1 hypothetical protein [Kingella sp. (in: b-proteobacteria)]